MPWMGKTFTQGSRLTNHQIIYTGQDIPDVMNVSKLLCCALNWVFTKYFILEHSVSIARFQIIAHSSLDIKILILEGNHTNVMCVARNVVKVFIKYQHLWCNDTESFWALLTTDCIRESILETNVFSSLRVIWDIAYKRIITSHVW